ncbi:MAG: HYR domain-containing protein, partial [Crocinitomicaceae bacterium]|nr:HYR domain-containing protein [Crocinitomicaceae bacterium]
MRILLPLIIITYSISSFSQDFEWAGAFLPTSFNSVKLRDMDIDDAGNSYSTGYFRETVDFDPGTGTSFFTAPPGENSGFLAKLNEDGDYVWSGQLVSTDEVECESLVVDENNDVIITGIFRDVTDFDFGPGVLNLNPIIAGQVHLFIAKYDSDGNLIWAKMLSGGPEPAEITSDLSNNILITGEYGGTTDFDPGPGTFNLTHLGSRDIFVLKLDSDGNFMWAGSVGGSGGEGADDIVADLAGNVYVSGSFNETGDYDPGAGTVNLFNSGSSDIFILKLDFNGDYLWAKKIGGSWVDDAYSLDVDVFGNVIFAGRFGTTVDFDPGIGLENRSTLSAGVDMFFCKFDNDGNFVWVKTIGTSDSNTDAFTLETDEDGNILISGQFGSDGNLTDFDPSSGVENLVHSSGSSPDIFIAKYTNDGDYLWAGNIGGPKNDQVWSVVPNGSDSFYFAGIFSDLADLDPTSGVSSVTGGLFDNGYVIKMSIPCTETTFSFSENDCSEFTVPSGDETYTTLGTYTVMDTIPNAEGCDSVLTISLTIGDAEDPVIAGCPSDISVTADASGCTSIVTWTAPTATDNCVTPTLVSSHASGSSFSVGTTTVTYTATDGAGNSSTCEFDVTVTNNLSATVS